MKRGELKVLKTFNSVMDKNPPNNKNIQLFLKDLIEINYFITVQIAINR